MNYGAEYIRSEDHSSQRYIASDKPDFDNTQNEDVANVYVGTQCSFDWGLSFNVSAKGEYYHNKYRHNWNFIPQLGATYYRTPKAFSSSTSAHNASIHLIGSCMAAPATSMTTLL